MSRTPSRWNPIARLRSRPPRGRLERLSGALLWGAAAAWIGALVAPGLFGAFFKASARTVGLMLVFLLLARVLSARIRRIFGGSGQMPP